jgi:hypothetical protein
MEDDDAVAAHLDPEAEEVRARSIWMDAVIFASYARPRS